MIALVRLLMSVSTLLTDILYVSRLTSQKTGRAPTYSTTLAVEIHVNEGTRMKKNIKSYDTIAIFENSFNMNALETYYFTIRHGVP